MTLVPQLVTAVQTPHNQTSQRIHEQSSLLGGYPRNEGTHRGREARSIAADEQRRQTLRDQ